MNSITSHGMAGCSFLMNGWVSGWAFSRGFFGVVKPHLSPTALQATEIKNGRLSPDISQGCASRVDVSPDVGATTLVGGIDLGRHGT